MKWIMIDFAGMSPSKKTNIWAIRSTQGDDRLGFVKWHGPWRKYAFFPEPNCLFEEDCLRDIADFVEGATWSHKEERKERMLS